MSRRNSSLVTVALGNITANAEEELPPPYTTTTVIEIGDDDEINAHFPSSGSTERIFRIFVEDANPQVDSTLDQTQHNSSGTCSKLRCWFQGCCNGNSFVHSCERISGFFTAKFRAINEMLESRCEKSYLEAYFLYANICGVSPFRFGKENKPVVWLKKIPYYVVNTLAAIGTALLTKSVILTMAVNQEKQVPEIRVYLYSAVHGATILLRVGMFVSLKFQFKKYYDAIEAIGTSSFRKHLYTIKSQVHSLLISTSSVIVVLITTHIGLLNGFEDYVKENAQDALSLLCFNSTCHQSDSLIYDLSSTMTNIFGLLGWAMRLSGNMLCQIALDGVLFSALTLGKSANAFKFKERLTAANLENANIHEIGAEIRTEYKDIKKISKCINSAFNLVFRFFLLASIFVFAVFLEEYFNPRIWKVSKAVKSANVLLVCITFYYANVAAKTGERFRDWMKEEENRNILGISELNVVTEILSSSSIGYGRGALFIYDSTLIGFASAVVAYFLGIVETRPPNDMEDMLSPFQNSSNIH